MEDTSKIKGVDAREKILEAALELFSSNGYHATTTRKIAELADVNEVTLFRQFNSKKELFYEVLKLIKEMGLNVDRLKPLVESPRSLVKFVIHEMAELLETNPRQFRLMQYAALDGVEGFNEEFAFVILDQAMSYLSNAFKSLVEKGETLSSLPAEDLAMMLITIVFGSVSRRVTVPNSMMDHYNRRELTDKILALFLKPEV